MTGWLCLVWWAELREPPLYNTIDVSWPDCVVGLCHRSLYRSQPDRSGYREGGSSHSCKEICWGQSPRCGELGRLVLIILYRPLPLALSFWYSSSFRLRSLSFCSTSASSLHDSSNGAPGLLLVLYWPGELPVSWYVLIDLSVNHFWKSTPSRIVE